MRKIDECIALFRAICRMYRQKVTFFKEKTKKDKENDGKHKNTEKQRKQQKHQNPEEKKNLGKAEKGRATRAPIHPNSRSPAPAAAQHISMIILYMMLYYCNKYSILIFGISIYH